MSFLEPTLGHERETSPDAPSPAKGKNPGPGEIVWRDEPGAIIIVGAPGPERLKKPKPSSIAPSPPKDGSLRPEDVVFEEMDDGIWGIIITAPPNPAWARKKNPESDK
jgi:hypothetical protein